MGLKYPVKLKIEVRELDDGRWWLSYEEYFKLEDLEAYKNSMKVLKAFGVDEHFDVAFNEEEGWVKLSGLGSRDDIFNYVCGEFFILSGFAKRTLQELFVLSGFGIKGLQQTLDIKEEKVNG